METESYLDRLDERMHFCAAEIKTLLSHDDDHEQSEMELKGQEECTYGSVRCSDGLVHEIVPFG